jgi:cathepsin F
MSKSIILLLVLASLSLSAFAHFSAEAQWGEFKYTHRKVYSRVEERYRFAVFKNNLLLAQKYQAANPQAKFGVTKFSDLTPEEFKVLYLGLVRKANISEKSNYYKPSIKDIPASWDWNQKGAVTDVKDQGNCGSCWAFSAIQNIESQNFLKHNQLIDLSEQQLVDCDKIDQGCNGGEMQIAFQWLADHGGVASEADYPYTGWDETCKFTPSMAKVLVTGYLNISTNESEIAQSLVELGPLAVGVVADPWQFYIEGIIGPEVCDGDLDHGVLLVGYGHGMGIISAADFWLIKNSWGGGWGEAGYVRLERGFNACGMNEDVSTAIIA